MKFSPSLFPAPLTAEQEAKFSPNGLIAWEKLLKIQKTLAESAEALKMDLENLENMNETAFSSHEIQQLALAIFVVTQHIKNEIEDFLACAG